MPNKRLKIDFGGEAGVAGVAGAAVLGDVEGVRANLELGGLSVSDSLELGGGLILEDVEELCAPR